MCRYRFGFFLVVLFAWVFHAGATSIARAQQSSDSPSTNKTDPSLEEFLREYDKPSTDATARYVAAFVDLNGDGLDEVIVYLAGRKF